MTEERGTVPGYRALLGAPGRLAFVVPGMIGRLPLAMRGLGCVLLIQGYTGSYGLAGTMAAVQSIVGAVAGPRLGRLADRRSHRLVLAATLLVQAIATVALIVFAAGSAPVIALAIAAALIGASGMPFSSISRAIWSAHLRRGPVLERAFTVESMLDQVAFTAGPFVVILLAVQISPAAGVIGGLMMSVLATIGFARLPHLGATQETAPAAHAPVMRIRGMQVLVLAFVGLGLLYGAVEVGLIAFAQEHGHPGAASFLVSLFAGGSLIGAVVYGAHTWRTPVARRATVAITWLCLATLPIAFAPGIGWSALAILVAGLSISPGEIASFTLVEQLVAENARTEGFTWILSAIAAGAAGGTVLSGVAIDALDARAGLLIAVAGGALAVACLVLGAPALHRPQAVVERTGQVA